MRGRLKGAWHRARLLRRRRLKTKGRRLGVYPVLLLGIGLGVLLFAARPDTSAALTSSVARLGSALSHGMRKMLPLTGHVLRVPGESLHDLLSQTLPRSWGGGSFERRAFLEGESVRTLLYQLTGFDPTQPDTVLTAELPGSAAVAARLRFAVTEPGSEVVGTPSPRYDELPTVPPARGPDPPTGPVEPRVPGERTELLPETEHQGGTAPSELVPPDLLEAPGAHGPLTLDDLMARAAWGTEPLVAIVHTHPSEMYRTDGFAPERAHEYHRFGTYETGILRVGERLADTLEEIYGIPTVHDRTLHDTPCHSCAYLVARKTIENLVATYPSLRFIIDVHRDGAEELSMLVGNGDERFAQVALVVGRPDNLGRHPRWEENDRLARHIGELLDEKHPGVFRRIIHLNGVYNQDLHPGALLVEIGNYYDHETYALRTAELLAAVVAEALYEEIFGERSNAGGR